MKTTIEMPDDLFRRAKAVAALRGQSMKQFISQLLERELDPAPAASAKDRKDTAQAFSQELEKLAAQVSREWKSGCDASEAISEQRRG